MARTQYWIGTTSTAFGTAGNWSAGFAPANGDTCIFNNGSTPFQPTSDLDQHLVTLANLYVLKTWVAGTLGSSSATPLKIAVSGALVIQGGAGSKVYIDSGASAPIATCTVAMENPADTVSLGLTSGVFTKTLLKSGTVTLYGGTFTNIFMEAKSMSSGNLTVTQGACAVTALQGLGGNFTSNDAAGTQGTLNWERDTCTLSAGAATTINVRSPGTVVYNTPDGGTGPAIEVWPLAVFDASQDPRSKTIASATVHSNGQLLGDNRTGTIAFTSAPKNPLGNTTSQIVGAD